jgi:HAD superfamily hydrolase (TIGR01509 family)
VAREAKIGPTRGTGPTVQDGGLQNRRSGFDSLVPRLIDAVIFDLDGVLLDSESAWLAAKRAVVDEWGGTWKEEASRAMLGMSAPEWSVYMRDELAVERAPEEIDAEVVKRLLVGYRERLPLLPGAVEAVERLAARWPLGLASSSNLEVIEVVMEAGGFAPSFDTWVSSEEVSRGKPAPDVFLEAARRMEADPASCAAIEDSHTGILAAHAAGMTVFALPNHEFPPGEAALAKAARVLESLDQLTVETITGLSRTDPRD